ncbi:MAG TPA: TraB/GumN family protein [Sphingomicrobium sp.]|jgi:uncharacterized protein YbaP (TraB family)
MVNLFVAAALAAASPVMPDAPAAQPAMFKIEDSDTTIYLFGTFHALDGDARWFDERVRAAFDQSDQLVLETLLPEPGEPPQLFNRPLRAPSVTPSASVLATTRMAINAGRSQGMRIDQGADMVLRHVAEAAGKPVEGLETLEFQLNMFNKMRVASPAKAARAAPPAAARSSDTLSRTMGEMQAAWKRGDQAVFVHMLDQLRAGSPSTYKMMFTERNARWADWVAARMRSPGVVFVAVGTGHLAGADSLLVRLAEKGIESRRVN